jgi:glycosyltransferase involved in cell wall biosynthesis
MKLAVVIPTYRRSFNLDRCLQGLAAQQRPADQIIIVVRPEDDESTELLERWKHATPSLPILLLWIETPGVIQALNLALANVTQDILVVTDDDSFALPDWLARIESRYEADPALGGVGGRDLIHEDGRILPATKPKVGVIEPFGRVVGNHHLGLGPARRVSHLKGVNMSWRMAAITGMNFPTDLRGNGAQVFFELAFSLEVERRGWKIIYDPAIQVHHYVAQRFGDDQRVRMSHTVLAVNAYNFYIALRKYMRPGWRQKTALAWAWLIGTENNPGALRGLRARLRGDAEGIERRSAMVKAWDEACSESSKK